MECFDPLELSMIADGEDRGEEIERHLRECEKCRAEVERQRGLRRLVRGGSPKSLCPNGDAIARFLSGDASKDEREAVEAHAADCTPCRRMIFAPAEAASPASEIASKVQARLERSSRVRILRIASSVAAVLFLGVAVWLASPERARPFAHSAERAELVSLELSMTGGVTLDGGERVDLSHSVSESYEQKILRMDGEHPVEVERRSGGSNLVVRLRRTSAGRTEVATLTPNGAVEHLSVSDNLAVDEACELIHADAEAQRRILNRLLPKGVSIESLNLAREGASVKGSATLKVTATAGATREIRFDVSGELREGGSETRVLLKGAIDSSAQLRFTIRRASR